MTVAVFTPGNVVGTLVLGVAIYILYVVTQFLLYVRHTSKTYRDLPGPDRVHWLYGHLKDCDPLSLDVVLKNCRRFPRFYRFWNGPQPNIILTHPETVKILLRSSEPKPSGFAGAYRQAQPWLGTGLLTAGGKRWARSRRLLTPAFHFDVLRSYMNIYNDGTTKLLENISPYAANGNSFESFRVVSAFTLDTILKCAFSYETNCQNLEKKHPYVIAVGELAEIWFKRQSSPLLYADIAFSFSKMGRQFAKQCKYVHRVAEDIIDKRKKTLEAEGTTGRKANDFLDVLLMARDVNANGLTREEIRHEVDTFMFEGHDTTASAISWVLYSLATHPEHQTKVQEEIDHILEGRQSDRIEWDDLPKMEYLTLCIKEAMRLHSPIPFIQRESTREFTIDGKTFPPGTLFTISVFAVHINSTVWDNAMKFVPQRFLQENAAKMDSFAYIPFAAGSRNCIGQNFAMNEIKVSVARILHRYTIEVDPTVVVEKKVAITTRAKNGLYFNIKRRQLDGHNGC